MSILHHLVCQRAGLLYLGDDAGKEGEPCGVGVREGEFPCASTGRDSF